MCDPDILGALLLDLLWELDERRARVADLEAERDELRARVADLEADRNAYSDVAHAAIHRLHELTEQRDRERETVHRLLDELRWLRHRAA